MEIFSLKWKSSSLFRKFSSGSYYNAAEKFLKTFLDNISGSIAPEDILFSVMYNRK